MMFFLYFPFYPKLNVDNSMYLQKYEVQVFRTSCNNFHRCCKTANKRTNKLQNWRMSLMCMDFVIFQLFNQPFLRKPTRFISSICSISLMSEVDCFVHYVLLLSFASFFSEEKVDSTQQLWKHLFGHLVTGIRKWRNLVVIPRLLKNPLPKSVFSLSCITS